MIAVSVILVCEYVILLAYCPASRCVPLLGEWRYRVVLSLVSGVIDWGQCICSVQMAIVLNANFFYRYTSRESVFVLLSLTSQTTSVVKTLSMPWVLCYRLLEKHYGLNRVEKWTHGERETGISNHRDTVYDESRAKADGSCVLGNIGISCTQKSTRRTDTSVWNVSLSSCYGCGRGWACICFVVL